MEQHYGFKKLTVKNIIAPDTLGIQYNFKQEEWLSLASDFLKPKLSDLVPMETKKLFEVARGTIIYGLYFYPLYSVGTEQLFRVAENALKQKCMLLGIQLKRREMVFKPMLDKLVEMSVIPDEENEVWECLRQLRNISSHPDTQDIIAPAMALQTLINISVKINILFSNNG